MSTVSSTFNDSQSRFLKYSNYPIPLTVRTCPPLVFTHFEHIPTRSLSVVVGLRPLMYRLVFDNCSDPELVAGMLLLREVDTVPLWLPV